MGEIMAIGLSKIQIWKISIFSKKPPKNRLFFGDFFPFSPVAPCVAPLAILSPIYRFQTDILLIFWWFSWYSSRSIIGAQNCFGVVRYPIYRQNIADKNRNFNPCIQTVWDNSLAAEFLPTLCFSITNVDGYHC